VPLAKTTSTHSPAALSAAVAPMAHGPYTVQIGGNGEALAGSCRKGEHVGVENAAGQHQLAVRYLA
jgi:hypothetical protein